MHFCNFRPVQWSTSIYIYQYLYRFRKSAEIEKCQPVYIYIYYKGIWEMLGGFGYKGAESAENLSTSIYIYIFTISKIIDFQPVYNSLL